MESKKFVTIYGVLLFPLCVGSRAVILHDRGYTHTTAVVKIHGVKNQEIRFETRNTYYRLLPIPAKQEAGFRPAGINALLDVFRQIGHSVVPAPVDIPLAGEAGRKLYNDISRHAA